MVGSGPKAYQGGFSPDSLNYALALAGLAAPDMSAFSYAEIGCGWGLSVAAWAAQRPQGRFCAYEPSTVEAAWLAKLGQEAHLKNLAVSDGDFPAGRFDYVAVNGYLGRATAAEAQRLGEWLRDSLAPGGVLALRYEALPGSAAAGPLRRLMAEVARAVAPADPETAARQALGFLKELQAAGALFMRQPGAARWLDQWLALPPAHLASLISAGGPPLHFAEAQAFARRWAKADYVAPLDWGAYVRPLLASPASQQCLKRVAGDAALREEAQGLLYPVASRCDLFIRGPRPLPPDQAEKALGAMSAVYVAQGDAVPAEAHIDGLAVKPRPEVYAPLVKLLAKGPATLAGLAEAVGQPLGRVAQAVTALMAMGLAHVSPLAEPTPVMRFNQALDAALAAEQFPAVLSANGGWVACGPLERLYILARIKREKSPAAYMEAALRERSWLVRKDGQAVAPEAMMTFLLDRAQTIEKKLLPAFRRLGLCA